MTKFTFALTVIVLIALSSTVSATIIHVPADSSTIQAALNGCTTGDTVLVATGTYTLIDTYIVWPNTADIKLLSVGDASNTTIDANGNDHVFYINGSSAIIDSNTIIDGFKITGGHAHSSPPHNDGGGIYCYNASPTISNNNITGNSANDRGGAIYCRSSSPTISNNTITNNSVTYDGGGIYCYYCSSPIISNNTITGNSANNGGGGIYCFYYSSPTISNNTITNNSATYYGGGIYCYYYSSPTISNNTITNNSANDIGGGIYRYDSNSNPILGGSSSTTNNIYHNSPDNYYNGDNSFVEADYNYWGNFTSNEIEATFSGNTTYINFEPFVSEPLEVKQYAPSLNDTLYFVELTLTTNTISGSDTIRVKTYIDTLPDMMKDKDTYYINKFWTIELDDAISELSGELLFYYDDSEIEAEMEGNLNIIAHWDNTQWNYYSPSTINTMNNCITYNIATLNDYEGIWVLGYEGTGINNMENEPPVVSEYALSQNYPNPFNPSTVIKYQLPISSNAQLNIYNIKGQLVKTLINETQNSGYYNITWNGKDNDNREVASGLYVYRITAGDYVETRKMLLLK